MGEESERSNIFISPRAAPWLVIPYGGSSGTSQNQAFYNICEPNNRTYRKSIPELIAKRYWQKPSHQGWLIILCHDDKFDYSSEHRKYGDCFLWNPTTFKTIRLPSLSHWFGYSTGYYLVDCVLSSAPDNSESMVLFLFSDHVEANCNLVFLYFHPGDNIWRTNKWFSGIIPVKNMISLHCLKGKFYVMCSQFLSLEIEKHEHSRDGSIRLSIRIMEVRDKGLFPFIGGSENCYPVYTNFVATDDDLYCVPLIRTLRGYGKVVIQIIVMRLDFSVMEWKVVDSIGDQVLFIGSRNTTACCSAAEMGLARGCLFYTLPDDQSLYKFDIESTGNSVIVPCLKLPKPWQAPEFIMMPNKRKRKRQEDMVGKQECKKSLIKEEGCRTDEVHNHEDGKQVGDFEPVCTTGSILNGDVLDSIANSLHRLDYIHLRSVCKEYRALLPMVKLTSNSTTRGTCLSPWLMFSRDHSGTTFNFINPMHNNENYLMKRPDLMQFVVHFQKGGWLLVSKKNQQNCLFFYNPFTRETIKLPELGTNCKPKCVSFSSLPTSPDCVVYVIELSLRGYKCRQFGHYCIRKEEAIWHNHYRYCFNDSNTNTITEEYMPLHNTPVFYNGVVYCADYGGSLGVFNIEDYSWNVLQKPQQPFSAIYPSFLVECGGDLLLVKLERLGTLFGIFRLDFSRMEWVKIKSLGNHMLFVSHTSCFSAIAPNSRMENKVYFPRLCLNGEGVLFYCLETGSYRSFGSRHSASDFTDTEGWYSNCTWIEPNWSKSTAQELADWFKPPPR